MFSIDFIILNASVDWHPARSMSEFSGVTELIFSGSGNVDYHTSFLLKTSTLTHTCKRGYILPVRESMECIVRPAVTDDEAQRTAEHTDNQPHLTAADETPTAQTARATGAITIKLGNHQHSQTNQSLFYSMLSLNHSVPPAASSIFSLSFRLPLQHLLFPLTSLSENVSNLLSPPKPQSTHPLVVNPEFITYVQFTPPLLPFEATKLSKHLTIYYYW